MGYILVNVRKEPFLNLSSIKFVQVRKTEPAVKALLYKINILIYL